MGACLRETQGQSSLGVPWQAGWGCSWHGLWKSQGQAIYNGVGAVVRACESLGKLQGQTVLESPLQASWKRCSWGRPLGDLGTSQGDGLGLTALAALLECLDHGPAHVIEGEGTSGCSVVSLTLERVPTVPLLFGR